LEESGTFFTRGAYAYVMPKARSVDIDDELDFRMAEALLPPARGA
jgi:CMP-N-acetylneuraminic acid synthetase